MYYDLHVPWKAGEVAEVQHTLTVLKELGYNVVALSHTVAGKLPADLSCPIPEKLPFTPPANLGILRRCTLVLSDPSQNHRLQILAGNYDILALRPTNDKALQQACQSLECDIISLDLTMRLDSHFRMKTMAQAIDRGIKFEICYGPGIMTKDGNSRRNFISNATQLIRATRGRGLIISSEAHLPAACRAPADMINLAAVWGLGQEKGKEAIEKFARSVVVSAKMKRTSYRGVIDVVYGGEKQETTNANKVTGEGEQRKRKANENDSDVSSALENVQQISKRERKRQKKALLAKQSATEGKATEETQGG